MRRAILLLALLAVAACDDDAMSTTIRPDPSRAPAPSPSPAPTTQGAPDATAPTYATSEAPCTSSYQVGNVTILYADQAYPGVPLGQLAHEVEALGVSTTAGPPGFQKAPMFVSDGHVGASCGPATARTFEKVMFVRRQ